MTSVTITLRDEDKRFIADAMAAGRYVNESEAVSDAIAELRARDDLRQIRLTEVRSKVNVGLEQLDRGDSAAWNAEAIRTTGRALLEQRNAGG